jgi:hypothetical protein
MTALTILIPLALLAAFVLLADYPRDPLERSRSAALRKLLERK